jgi:hypothetical protein
MLGVVDGGTSKPTLSLLFFLQSATLFQIPTVAEAAQEDRKTENPFPSNFRLSIS